MSHLRDVYISIPKSLKPIKVLLHMSQCIMVKEKKLIYFIMAENQRDTVRTGPKSK